MLMWQLHAYYKHTKVFWTGSKVEQIGYTLYKHICNEIYKHVVRKNK